MIKITFIGIFQQIILQIVHIYIYIINLYIKYEIPGFLPRKLHHEKNKDQIYVTS